MSRQPSKGELEQQYKQYKAELSSLASKLGELELEKDEHKLVIDTISNLDPTRTCYRLIGGVLVQRTIKEVLPQVQTNMDGINTIIQQIVNTYKKKEEEMTSFTKKYDIQVK